MTYTCFMQDEEASLIANHILPEVLSHEYQQASCNQGSSEVREKVQDIFNELSEDPSLDQSLSYLTQDDSCSDSVSPFYSRFSRGFQLSPQPEYHSSGSRCRSHK